MLARGGRTVDGTALPLGARLAGLWVATVFCYVYGDLIGFYLPGRIAATAAGDLGPLGKATPQALLAISVCMAVPIAMVGLSLHLPARVNRGLNLTFGFLYTAIALAMVPAAPPFHRLLDLLAAGFTAAIAWQSWRGIRAG